LFSAAAAPTPKKRSEVEEMLKSVEPDALTPKQALEILYELKTRLSSLEGG
jgi:DNA mismatch repair protein MutS